MTDKAQELCEALRIWWRNESGRDLSPGELLQLLEWCEKWIISSQPEKERMEQGLFGMATTDYLNTLSNIINTSANSMKAIENFIEENQKLTLGKLRVDLDKIKGDIRLENAVHQKTPNIKRKQNPLNQGIESLLKRSEEAYAQEATLAEQSSIATSIEALNLSLKDIHKQTISEIQKSNKATMKLIGSLNKEAEVNKK